jgi:hypothetical protein
MRKPLVAHCETAPYVRAFTSSVRETIALSVREPIALTIVVIADLTGRLTLEYYGCAHRGRR